MTDDELASHFGWWWRNPAKALGNAFPEKSSEKAIRKYVWPELWQAAFNYELASRANGRKKYLLGKPFDRLAQKQMCDLARFWPRKPRPLQPIRFLPYAEQPDVTATLRRLADEEDSVVLDAKFLIQRAVKRAQRIETVEKKYAQIKGWTAPQYFTMNLAGCGDTSICKAFREHVKAERERLGIPAPAYNKGRANKSARGLSFGRIEALDVWTHRPRGEAEKTRYDDAEARSARRKAGRLFSEWTEWAKGK
jgi:hypothetical protein